MRGDRFASLVATLLGMGVAVSPVAAWQSAAVDSLILAQMSDQRIPGLAAAVLDSGRVVWMGTYGLASVEDQRPVTDDTPFQLASVTKPVTATVLLLLHADGRFSLDDDINDYLPFRVRNPSHPDVPITFRQLLRHRSSIVDNFEFYEPHWLQPGGDPSEPLGTYLEDYLVPGGEAYSASDNFAAFPPGAERVYCNTCFALIGYLAEVIAGQPFDSLAGTRLFRPLQMSHTGWFIDDFETVEPAIPYRFAADTGFVAYGHNGYPDWPAGLLRTSIKDLGSFMTTYLNGGVFEGTPVFPSMIVETLSPRDPSMGFLTWTQVAFPNLEILYGHSGADLGTRARVAFSRDSGRGVIILINGEASSWPFAEALYLKIDELKAAGSRD